MVHKGLMQDYGQERPALFFFPFILHIEIF